MRAITAEEIEKIAGARNPHTQHGMNPLVKSLPPVPVTTSPSYPFDSGPSNWWPTNPTDPVPPPDGDGGGLGGGGDAHHETTEVERELLKQITVVILAAETHDEIPAEIVDVAIDLTSLSAGLLTDNYYGGKNSWNAYKSQDGLAGGVWPEQVESPIDWGHFDWAKVPGALAAPTYDAALQDALEYYQSLDDDGS